MQKNSIYFFVLLIIVALANTCRSILIDCKPNNRKLCESKCGDSQVVSCKECEFGNLRECECA